jgi:hypothetical protein
MLSEEEKVRIVERIEFENQIRQELGTGKKEEAIGKRWAWLESPLSLLIIGAFLSGILTVKYSNYIEIRCLRCTTAALFRMQNLLPI